jgi:anti-sigma B factor antagonist
MERIMEGESYSVREINGVQVVEMPSRLAGTAGSESMDALLNDLRAAGAMKILLDCSPASYIDSAVLGSLVRAHMQILNEGGKLALLRPSGRIRSILEFTKLIHVFEIFEDEAAALASLNGSV